MIQVLIRIRPINSMESALQGNGRCLTQESSHTLTWTGHPETRFTFDHVACETTSQVRFSEGKLCLPKERDAAISLLIYTFSSTPEVRSLDEQETLFNVVGLPMVENCMSGYNSCMFAYGQVSVSSAFDFLFIFMRMIIKHCFSDGQR